MISFNKIEELLNGLRRKIENGSLVYWICPSIEENEESNLISIEGRYRLLKEFFSENQISIAWKTKC